MLRRVLWCRDETFRRKGREIRSGVMVLVVVGVGVEGVVVGLGWTSERRAVVKKVGWEGLLRMWDNLFLVFSNTLLLMGVVVGVLVFDRVVPPKVVFEAFDPSVYPTPAPAPAPTAEEEEEEYLSSNGRITFL
jgi:hypothetical protein